MTQRSIFLLLALVSLIGAGCASTSTSYSAQSLNTQESGTAISGGAALFQHPMSISP